MEESTTARSSDMDSGPRINPLAIDPLTVSPCKRRPDTGQPCPLKNNPKRIGTCPCGLIDPAKPVKTHDELIAMIASGVISKKDTDDDHQETPMEGQKQSGPTKVCSRKDCPHNGQPQPLDDFDKSKGSKDGHSSNCKTCRRIMQRKTSKKKKPSQPKKQKPAIQTQPDPPAPTQPEPDNTFILKLDFSQRQDLLRDFTAQAAEQERTVKAHAFFVIKQAVCQ